MAAKKKTTKKLDPVSIGIVLDRSGSMNSCKDETISAFNGYLEKTKAGLPSAVVTMVQFDTEYETMYSNVKVSDVKPLNSKTFQPRGYTALYDAVGRAVKEMDQPKVKKKLVCIITDGHENSSREFSQLDIKALVESRRKQGWEFIFLSGTLDAPVVGASLGVAGGQSVMYASLAKSFGQTYSATMGFASSNYQAGDLANAIAGKKAPKVKK